MHLNLPPQNLLRQVNRKCLHLMLELSSSDPNILLDLFAQFPHLRGRLLGDLAQQFLLLFITGSLEFLNSLETPAPGFVKRAIIFQQRGFGL